LVGTWAHHPGDGLCWYQDPWRRRCHRDRAGFGQGAVGVGPALPPTAALGSTTLLSPSLSARSFYNQEAAYLLAHPAGDHGGLHLVDDTHVRYDPYLVTTTDIPLWDAVGSKVTQGLYSVLGGIAERIDPGLAPGVEADKRAFAAYLDADVRARNTRTVVAYTPTTVYDGSHYVPYVDPGYHPTLNPYNS